MGRALTETSNGFREEVEGAEPLPLAPDEDSPHEKPVDEDDDDEDADVEAVADAAVTQVLFEDERSVPSTLEPASSMYPPGSRPRR